MSGCEAVLSRMLGDAMFESCSTSTRPGGRTAVREPGAGPYCPRARNALAPRDPAVIATATRKLALIRTMRPVTAPTPPRYHCQCPAMCSQADRAMARALCPSLAGGVSRGRKSFDAGRHDPAVSRSIVPGRANSFTTSPVPSTRTSATILNGRRKARRNENRPRVVRNACRNVSEWSMVCMPCRSQCPRGQQYTRDSDQKMAPVPVLTPDALVTSGLSCGQSKCLRAGAH